MHQGVLPLHKVQEQLFRLDNLPPMGSVFKLQKDYALKTRIASICPFN